MLTKARQKWIRSLHLKKYRQQSNRFIAEGTKVVLEIIHSGWQVESLYATTEWLEQHGPDSQRIGEVVSVKESDLRTISALQSPSPVLAIVEPLPVSWQPSDLAGRLSLYLDHLRDPGNLGTIIRVADWFGIQHVLCTTDTVDLYNPKVVQSTMGSLTRVKVAEVADNWWETLADMSIWGADMEGTSVYDIGAPVTGILCIGSESHGLSERVRQQVTQYVSIPRVGEAESLNAAMATGILLSHLVRR